MVRLSFDDISKQFDTQRGLPRPALNAWLEFVNDLAAGRQLRIIEPGIGTGRLALPLAAIGHQISGADISRQMLQECERSASKLKISPRIYLTEADAVSLPFNDHQFDLGIIAQLLYLVPDWPTVLDELARLVKPGGHVIHLAEPTSESEALALWSSTWREMIEATGYRHIELSPTDDQIEAEFLRRWPDVEQHALTNWHFGQTVAEAMVGYRVRLRPLYAEVSDDVFDHVVDMFLSWAKASFPDPSTQLGGTVTLTVLIAST